MKKYSLFLYFLFLNIYVSKAHLCDAIIEDADHYHATISEQNMHRDYPQNYFRSPVDIPILLAGTFGELRPNHFHGGIDIKTEQREGLNIYAVAEGYVSRVNISGGGYGNALYITHPNGYTSVYGHLKSFNSKIKQAIRDRQYSENKSILDMQFAPGEIPVSSAEIVALSGNTGGSQGPHLHFEIRDAVTEATINPLLFGFKVLDTQKPSIKGLMIYTFDESKNQLSRKAVSISSGAAALQVVNAPYVGFSINTIDGMNGTDNNNGIYSITLQQDQNTIFQYLMETFTFGNQRSIHAHIDYDYFFSTGSRYHRLQKLKGDQLECYRDEKNDGFAYINSGETSEFKILVSDAAGNTSTVRIPVRYDGSSFPSYIPPSFDKLLPALGSSSFQAPGIQCDFSDGLFYEDVYLTHSIIYSPTANIYSDVHLLGKEKIPVHNYYNIRIQPKNIPWGKEGKAIIIFENKTGKKNNRGGEWDGTYIQGKAREFGKFYIMLDETPPSVSVTSLTSSSYGNLNFKINDGLSGIKTFDIYIDGQWSVMEYDDKTDRLWCPLEGKFAAGTHSYNLEVMDDRGNTTTKTGSFTISN